MKKLCEDAKVKPSIHLSVLERIAHGTEDYAPGNLSTRAEVAITSAASLVAGEGPPDAFRLEDVPGVAVEPRRAEGKKCARSWKILPSVGCDPEYPDVSPRDAQALREWEAMRKAAE